MKPLLLTLLVVLGIAPAGWMLFDGARRLLVGDYVRINGQLGPWTHVVSAVGLEPMGLAVAVLFIACGVARAAATVVLLARSPWAWQAMMASSIAILWYLPIGTASAMLTIVLLLLAATQRVLAGA